MGLCLTGSLPCVCVLHFTVLCYLRQISPLLPLQRLCWTLAERLFRNHYFYYVLFLYSFSSMCTRLDLTLLFAISFAYC